MKGSRILVIIVLTTLFVSSPVAADESGNQTIVVDYTVEQVQGSEVVITAETTIPETVQSLYMDAGPESAEVVRTDGFEVKGDRIVMEDGRRTGTVTYRVDINRECPPSAAVACVAGDVTLVDMAVLDYRSKWRYTGQQPDFNRKYQVGTGVEGHASESFVMVGEHQTITRTVEGEQLTLVFPDDTFADKQRVTTSYLSAARQLDVGSQRPATIFAAPTAIRNGGSVRSSSGWVKATEEVDSPHNVWIHEYVHTRQEMRLGEEMMWFEEASADYYSGLLTLRQGRTEFDTFEEYVRTTEYEDVVLAETSRQDQANYLKGRRVLAQLDVLIRTQSDGENDLETVIVKMNAHDGVVTYADFKSMVSEAAGQPMGLWLDEHVTTSASPDISGNASLYAETTDYRDSDHDGLSDREEFNSSTSPFDADTDDDGVSDGFEDLLRTNVSVGIKFELPSPA